MSAEVDALAGASYGARSDTRTNRRNGYRGRRWDTRAGTIDLRIPKLRQGSYFPAWLLERRRRSERALLSVITQAYVEGVSTRRVEDLVQAMNIDGISKSQTPVKTRKAPRRLAPTPGTSARTPIVADAGRNMAKNSAPSRMVYADALTKPDTWATQGCANTG